MHGEYPNPGIHDKEDYGKHSHEISMEFLNGLTLEEARAELHALRDQRDKYKKSFAVETFDKLVGLDKEKIKAHEELVAKISHLEEAVRIATITQQDANRGF